MVFLENIWKRFFGHPSNAERGERSEPSEATTGRHWHAQTNHWMQIKLQIHLGGWEAMMEFVHVWFDCLVCFPFFWATMNGYVWPCLVWLAWLFRFLQWNLNSTIKRRFPFQCQTRLLQNAIYIYIYTQTQLFEVSIWKGFWRHFGEVFGARGVDGTS